MLGFFIGLEKTPSWTHLGPVSLKSNRMRFFSKNLAPSFTWWHPRFKQKIKKLQKSLLGKTSVKTDKLKNQKPTNGYFIGALPLWLCMHPFIIIVNEQVTMSLLHWFTYVTISVYMHNIYMYIYILYSIYVYIYI